MGPLSAPLALGPPTTYGTVVECPRNEEGDVGFLVEFYVASFGSRDPENFLVGLENFRNPTHLPNQ